MRTGKRNLLLICGFSKGVLETMDSVLFRDNSHVPCATRPDVLPSVTEVFSRE